MKKFALVFLAFAAMNEPLINVHAENSVQDQIVVLEVTERGFQPKSLDVKENAPVVLAITRKTDSTCSKQIQIPNLKIKKDLPLNKEVQIKVGKLKKGEIKFGCGMHMMDSGIIHVR